MFVVIHREGFTGHNSLEVILHELGWMKRSHRVTIVTGSRKRFSGNLRGSYFEISTLERIWLGDLRKVIGTETPMYQRHQELNLIRLLIISNISQRREGTSPN